MNAITDAKRERRNVRKVAVLIGLAVAVVGALVALSQPTVYAGLNAGVAISTPCGSVGYEWAGDPGFFACQQD